MNEETGIQDQKLDQEVLLSTDLYLKKEKPD